MGKRLSAKTEDDSRLSVILSSIDMTWKSHNGLYNGEETKFNEGPVEWSYEFVEKW